MKLSKQHKAFQIHRAVRKGFKSKQQVLLKPSVINFTSSLKTTIAA